jgi:hypothetical protein
MLMKQPCTKHSRLKTSIAVSSQVMTCVVWYEANKTLEESATSMLKVKVGSNWFCCSITAARGTDTVVTERYGISHIYLELVYIHS